MTVQALKGSIKINYKSISKNLGKNTAKIVGESVDRLPAEIKNNFRVKISTQEFFQDIDTKSGLGYNPINLLSVKVKGRNFFSPSKKEFIEPQDLKENLFAESKILDTIQNLAK